MKSTQFGLSLVLALTTSALMGCKDRTEVLRENLEIPVSQAQAKLDHCMNEQLDAFFKEYRNYSLERQTDARRVLNSRFSEVALNETQTVQTTTGQAVVVELVRRVCHSRGHCTHDLVARKIVSDTRKVDGPFPDTTVERTADARLLVTPQKAVDTSSVVRHRTHSRLTFDRVNDLGALESGVGAGALSQGYVDRPNRAETCGATASLAEVLNL